MQATTGIQVTIVTPAASNSKDDSNSMTAHNSRNVSNRTANTVGMPAKAGMLEKVAVPATTCREGNYSRDTAKADTKGNHGCQQQQECLNQTIGKKAPVEKTATFSRDTSNSSRNSGHN